jgi:hypothetical protein
VLPRSGRTATSSSEGPVAGSGANGGVVLTEGDRALLAVTLCEFILDEYVEKLNVNLERAFAKEMDRARGKAEEVVARTGARVAEQVREAGAAVTADLERVLGARDRGGVIVAPRRVGCRPLYGVAASIGGAAILGAALARLMGR